jgi:SAM-dependent methyltransferase
MKRRSISLEVRQRGEYRFSQILKSFPALKTALRGILFRTGRYSDDHDGLERIFQTLEDPWNFETSPYEQDRLELLLDVVKKYPHRSILEVGCAEGVFTAKLAETAPQVVAIDVCPTAIARARERCAKPSYVTSSLEQFETSRIFDIAICAETLYYIKDVNSAIAKLSMLGRYCIVSYLTRESPRLDPYFARLPVEEFATYEMGKGIWKGSMTVVVWTNGDGHGTSRSGARKHH